MPGSISLPQVVLELEEEDRRRQEALEPMRSVVVRYGHMRNVAELPYDGAEKFGCGTKLVVRTARGIELAEMLTTTCPNAGCGSSVSRKQMLTYIEASGGKNFPFTTEGRVLRLATAEDLTEQARLDARRTEMMRFAKGLVAELDLKMRLVEVELLLGGERIIFHYTSESWVDFRELVRRLAQEYQTRIEMHQVNARDEARLVADYEKCGQHCCCRQFLKVLKPVSMRSAKVQKATLDPGKISGRCGRLMCCLRYEDETYESLRKRLPHRQSRMITPDGFGTVLDTQILTQLVLVELDSNGSQAAYPLETLQPLPKDQDPGRPRMERDGPPRPGEGPRRGGPAGQTRPGQRDPAQGPRPGSAGPGARPPAFAAPPAAGPPADTPEPEEVDDDQGPEEDLGEMPATPGSAISTTAGSVPPADDQMPPGQAGPPPAGGKKKRRRRRRKRRPGDGAAPGSPGNPGNPGNSGNPGAPGSAGPAGPAGPRPPAAPPPPEGPPAA